MGLADIKMMEDVYNRTVQEQLAKAIDDGDITGAISTGIKIHNKRNNIMVGLHNRARLEAASTFKWDNPREADGVPIYAREQPSSTDKENHKLHTPFDRVIAMQKASYMVGIAPEPVINENDKAQESLKDRLRQLNFETGISELGQKAAGRGAGYILLASPPADRDAYVTYPDEWSCFIIYDIQTGQPLYGVRYWIEIRTQDSKQPGDDESRKIKGEFYDKTYAYQFEGTADTINTLGEQELHLFSGVPLIEFPNNTERLSDVELTISLQDAFDIADSDISSEISQLRLAYLSLPDTEVDIDDDWLKTLRQTGVFVGDGKFIEKNLNSAAVENLKADLEMRIYKYSNSYNPDELGADKALTAFQIQQKLLRLESSSKETELMFRESLTRMILMLSEFYNVSIDKEDLSWKFTRNTPRNSLEDIKLAVESGFRLSQAMMARLMPFEIDQMKNVEELEEEAMSLSEEDPLDSTVETVGE